MNYKINFLWDNDAGVWTAISEDVPGLVLESGSFDALIEKVKFTVPELMELNGIKAEKFKLSYHAEREDLITVDSKIKSRHTANAIMKQSGINHHFK